MILHFKHDADRLNVFFERGNYNMNYYPESQYIEVSAEDLERIRREIDFNCYDYEDDLTKTEAQKKNDIDRKIWTDKIIDALDAGKIPRKEDGFYTIDGKKIGGWTPERQRILIYAIISTRPEMNNSQIAKAAGTTRNTVRKYRAKMDAAESG